MVGGVTYGVGERVDEAVVVVGREDEVHDRPHHARVVALLASEEHRVQAVLHNDNSASTRLGRQARRRKS